jgi:citrate synthase
MGGARISVDVGRPDIFGCNVQIGKPGSGQTAIASPRPDRVVVRGHDLVGELIGSLSFSEFFFLLTCGRRPTADQAALLDACLVALAEHGLTPTVVAARMTLAADPAALQGAVAAGILGCGTVVLGTAALAYRAIEEIAAEAKGGDPAEAARRFATACRAGRRPLPGFGHPLHKPLDPRADRLIALARTRAVAGQGVAIAEAMVPIAAEVWGRPLPMNVSMAIAAVLHDAGVPFALVRGLPIVARAAGLVAHLAEEAENPIGFRMAAEAEAAIDYSGPEPAPPHV